MITRDTTNDGQTSANQLTSSTLTVAITLANGATLHLFVGVANTAGAVEPTGVTYNAVPLSGGRSLSFGTYNSFSEWFGWKIGPSDGLPHNLVVTMAGVTDCIVGWWSAWNGVNVDPNLSNNNRQNGSGTTTTDATVANAGEILISGVTSEIGTTPAKDAALIEIPSTGSTRGHIDPGGGLSVAFGEAYRTDGSGGTLTNHWTVGSGAWCAIARVLQPGTALVPPRAMHHYRQRRTSRR